ncbi:MAG: RNA polymerase sigma-70 factor, ECF subfamily [Bacteroidetes bacterium]|nr:MAG: RNA polymerase sigma-70 factor, ECF subfamily [Bacteroidota bacterium]
MFYANALFMNAESKYHASKEQILSEHDEIVAAQREPALFEPLYNRYYERILRFVYQRTDSRDDAYDITSQVFISALENLKKYKHQGVPFSAWLFRIASNELNKMFRKNKVRQAVNVDDEQVSDILLEIGHENTAETDSRLMLVLKQLEPEEIQLVEMRFFEKRAFKEIADILDIQEPAVKARLYRLLERMKNMITKLQ